MNEDAALDEELTRALVRTDVGIVVDGEVMSGGEIYRMIDEFDAALIAQNVDPEVVESWCYAFPAGAGKITTGLSVRGVEVGIREMMKHGEIIRTDKPTVEYEDADEIRLTCTARRFIVRPDTGEMLEVDFATRALRQLKYQMIDEMEETGEKWPSGQPKKRKTGKKIREDDPKWYEKAYAKAARNAAFPLLRSDVKSEMIQTFKRTERFASIAENRPYQEGRALSAAPPAKQVAAPAQQQRENAPSRGQRGQGARNAAPPTTNTRETSAAPSAPSQPAQATDPDPRISRAGGMLRDIRSSQGEERYRSVYADLLRTFPGASSTAGALNNVAGLDDETLGAFVARLEKHQAGVDPDAPDPSKDPPEEPAPGYYEEIDEFSPPPADEAQR